MFQTIHIGKEKLPITATKVVETQSSNVSKPHPESILKKAKHNSFDFFNSVLPIKSFEVVQAGIKQVPMYDKEI